MNKLREVRFFKRVTQPLLALKTVIQQPMTGLIENELVIPKEDESKKIAEALGTTVQDVFTTDEL